MKKKKIVTTSRRRRMSNMVTEACTDVWFLRELVPSITLADAITACGASWPSWYRFAARKKIDGHRAQYSTGVQPATDSVWYSEAVDRAYDRKATGKSVGDWESARDELMSRECSAGKTAERATRSLAASVRPEPTAWTVVEANAKTGTLTIERDKPEQPHVEPSATTVTTGEMREILERVQDANYRKQCAATGTPVIVSAPKTAPQPTVFIDGNDGTVLLARVRIPASRLERVLEALA